jgi:hypothetical protein
MGALVDTPVQAVLIFAILTWTFNAKREVGEWFIVDAGL